MKRNAGRGLFLEITDADPGIEQGFADWYETVRLPALANCPGVLAGRRFIDVASTVPRHLGIYDLATPDVLQSAPWLDALASSASHEGPDQYLARTHAHTYLESVPEIAEPGSPARTVGDDTPMARSSTRGLLVATIDVVPSFEDEFDRWYELEHLADRAACEGFLSARRFLRLSGSLTKFLAVYDMVNPDVLDSEAYRKIGARTPWGFRVKEHWLGTPGRDVFREIGPVRA